MKELALGNRVTGVIDLNDGSLRAAFNSFSSEDFAIPLNLTHVYKNTNEDSNYGKNWHLNLDRMLKVSPTDKPNDTKFVYTDELGDKYDFEEKYYYVQNGEMNFLAKDSVSIDYNGNLSFGGQHVYKQQCCNGYTVIPEINDFINSELIEHRHENIVNTEETVKQYRNALRDYVCVHIASGNIFKSNEQITREMFEEFMSLTKDSYLSEYIIIQQNEVVQYKALLESKASFNEQLKNLYADKKENQKDIDEFKYYENSIKEAGGASDAVLNKYRELKIVAETAERNNMLMDRQIDSINSQLNCQINPQIEYIVSQARKNRNVIK